MLSTDKTAILQAARFLFAEPGAKTARFAQSLPVHRSSLYEYFVWSARVRHPFHSFLQVRDSPPLQKRRQWLPGGLIKLIAMHALTHDPTRGGESPSALHELPQTLSVLGPFARSSAVIDAAVFAPPLVELRGKHDARVHQGASWA